MFKHQFICFHAIVEQKSTILANFEGRVGGKSASWGGGGCPLLHR